VDLLMIVLRVLHIGAGVLWVGTAAAFFLFVQPTLAALGQNAGQAFMTHVTRERRLTQVMIVATVTTVGAGAILYYIRWQQFGALWFQSGFGIGMTIGAVAALIAFAMGPTMIGRTIDRISGLGAEIGAAGGPPSAAQAQEMERLGRRMKTLLTVDFALLAVAVVFMAIARYL
jgi:hypothetical protein